MLLNDFYKMMIFNRPVPWIGMPVWYLGSGGEWGFVMEVRGDGAAGSTHGLRLHTYREESPDWPVGRHGYGSENTKEFILPGEKDAPPMGNDFLDELETAYCWGDSYKYVDGLWQRWKRPIRFQRHMTLIIPYGEDQGIVFPNNSTTNVQGLKELNTDGRTECAQCGGSLASLWIGNTNLSHCPKCEP